MHIRLSCTFVLLLMNFCSYTNPVHQQLRLPVPRQFLLLRTNTINQRACTCSTPFSCSCCETVTLIYSKTRKTLCSNFMYQRNGMNVDISMNSDTFRTTTVTNYRPFKLCTAIPGSLFSSICVNVLELNEFPRSITVCVRHEILSKFQEWQINYTCVSISTTLPMISANVGMTTTVRSSSVMPSTSRATMPVASSMAGQGSTMRPMMSSQMMGSTTRAPMMMMMMTGNTMMTMMMRPNGTGAPPPSRPPPQMTAVRNRRYAENQKFGNHWSRIVNEKIGISPIELANSVRPIATAIRRPSATISDTSTIVVSSYDTADTKISIHNDMTLDYNERPRTVTTNFDSSEYFPSRIPPVVAASLKTESINNPNRDAILFVADNNNYAKIKTDTLIFPN